MAYADLEIGLHRQDADSYRIELRFSMPKSDSEIRLGGDTPILVHLDMDELCAQELDPDAYGLLLGERLFNNARMKTAFAQAISNAQSNEVPLRLRLFVGPSAPELNALRWETLRHPQDGSSLLTSEHILFSRYLSSYDWRPVRLRPRADLRSLVLIANPSDLSEKSGGSLAAIDVDGEVAQVKTNLRGTIVKQLASNGSATMDNMIGRLREGVDILYLLCHGTIKDHVPWLWLEDDDGATRRVAGSEFVTRLKELKQRPRLVVLASCQSAGTGYGASAGDAGILAALGPCLAEAGIPAVLAMQGSISIETVSRFMPVFFKELSRDGQIDRAIAVARGTVRDRFDCWMPALFMRLKSGRIWYAPGFAGEQRALEKWPSLLRHIRRGRCTPILGPGLTEPMFGSRREIAQRWAETHHFPMEPYHQEDLPQVAQYLTIHLDRMFPRDDLIEHLCREIRARFSLPDTLQDASLDELVTAIGGQCWEGNEAEPHRVLAELPLPIYITTNPGSVLKEALLCAGKAPQVEFCRWNDRITMLPSIYDSEPAYRPDAARPLVYHLFGTLNEPDSLVLTEDDYFDYLIGVTRNSDLIPQPVLRALTDSALLFLGFQLGDWNFRILFRSIMLQEGGSRLRNYAHVAAQVDPEQGRILEPEGARRYLEKYFMKNADVSIYWGSPSDFAEDLRNRWVKEVA
jgi:CHAT domain/SIR2-like domain